MFRFFRRIRKTLLALGSNRKYFLYALGEIALVVVGILIALQINNWNEFRKERIVENEMLSQLLVDLERTYRDHDLDFKIQTNNLKSTWIVLDILDNSNINYEDTMATHFIRSSIDDYSYPISKTYETLKSSGSKIISNDNLRNLIHILYEDTYPRLVKNTGYTTDIYELMLPYMKNHFTVNEFDLEKHKAFVESDIEHNRPGSIIAEYQKIGYRPLDFDIIRTDPEYRFLINQTVRLRGFKLATIKRALTQTEQAISLIKKELDIQEDKEVLELISPFNENPDVEMDRIIGRLEVVLHKAKPEGTLGNWMMDIILNRANNYVDPPVDFAIYHSGGIRLQEIKKGDVTVRHIFDLIPFENEIVIMEVEGPVMWEMIERMAAAGGWPVSEGFEMVIDQDRTPKEVLIQGEPFDSSRTYRIALPDYIANGWDGCRFLMPLPRYEMGLKVLDAIIEYMDQNKNPMSATLENRVVSLGN